MNTHRAKKSLGQNFLVDPGLQRRIVDALDPHPDDTVIEIGPGQGALTQHLAPRVGRLILIELDRDLAPALAERFRDDDHVTVVQGDVLEIDIAAHVDDMARVKVVGNIPYNITTPIIFRLLERTLRPALIVLMIQREVADRILSPAGDGEYGALSVGVRTVAHVERMFHVGRGAFRPVPRVDSTVIRITPLRPPPLDAGEEEALRTLTRVLFSQRRKQLQKILRSAPDYALTPEEVQQVVHSAGVDAAGRPEMIDPEHMIRLAAALRELQRSRAA